ncbi:hypothetical protein OQA88_817 [Cercophora sp. LCS_1]
MAHPHPFFSSFAALCFLVLGAECHVLLLFSRLSSRASSFKELPTHSAGHVYIVNATVGEPGQAVSLVLSPSSPQTFVPNADSYICGKGYRSYLDRTPGEPLPDLEPENACVWGSYTPQRSYSFKMSKETFGTFNTHSTLVGPIDGLSMTETLEIGNVQVRELPIVNAHPVGNQHWIGRLGLGSAARNNGDYESFIDRLVPSGDISSPAYSIWLNDPEGRSGSLLLGAIDRSRYMEPLVRIPANFDHILGQGTFAVSLHSLHGIRKSDYSIPVTNTGGLTVALDTAEVYSYLPGGLADSIMGAVGASWDETLARAFIRCDAATDNPAKIRFVLGGEDSFVLSASVADLIVPQEVTAVEMGLKGQVLKPNQCAFGVQKYREDPWTNNPVYVLGSSLLRRAYMVFDGANQEKGEQAAANNAGEGGTQEMTMSGAVSPPVAALNRPLPPLPPRRGEAPTMPTAETDHVRDVSAALTNPDVVVTPPEGIDQAPGPSVPSSPVLLPGQRDSVSDVRVASMTLDTSVEGLKLAPKKVAVPVGQEMAVAPTETNDAPDTEATQNPVTSREEEDPALEASAAPVVEKGLSTPPTVNDQAPDTSPAQTDDKQTITPQNPTAPVKDPSVAPTEDATVPSETTKTQERGADAGSSQPRDPQM